VKTLHRRVLSGIALTAVLCCLAAVPAAQAAQAAWRAPRAGRAPHAAPGRSQTVVDDGLSGVSATSPADAWAVGFHHCAGCKIRTGIVHWNGTTWSPVTSPNPATGENILFGVSADSAADAWAVGWDCPHGCRTVHTLILHWNGTAWSHAVSPTPGTEGNLGAVSAVSPADAWAAGSYCPTSSCNPEHTLLLHWNGTAWSHVASPNPGKGGSLSAVSAVSSADAWAAGSYCPPSLCNREDTLLLHWNGTAWSTVASPNSGSAQNELNAVSAISPGDAWAVGDHCSSSVNLCHALILRWNGTQWTYVKGPDLGPYWASLSGVTAISPADAWAVGTYCTRPTPCSGRPLILHWNGKTWSQVSTPGQPGESLSGVTATAANNAWAVGGHLILHWNGKTWSD
jgi:hypothetical protein